MNVTRYLNKELGGDWLYNRRFARWEYCDGEHWQFVTQVGQLDEYEEPTLPNLIWSSNNKSEELSVHVMRMQPPRGGKE